MHQLHWAFLLPSLLDLPLGHREERILLPFLYLPFPFL
jgi:hypothetical protein